MVIVTREDLQLRKTFLGKGKDSCRWGYRILAANNKDCRDDDFLLRGRKFREIQGRSQQDKGVASVRVAYGKTGGHETAKARSHQDEIVAAATESFQGIEPCLQVTLKIRYAYIREVFCKPLSLGSFAGRIQAVKKECFAHGHQKIEINTLLGTVGGGIFLRLLRKSSCLPVNSFLIPLKLAQDGWPINNRRYSNHMMGYWSLHQVKAAPS